MGLIKKLIGNEISGAIISVTSQLGFSFGVGFKFKPVGNKINLNYYFGNRKYSNISEKEFIQQIQVGISLADIWFVKRRQK